jgi:hypothetical protein
MPTADDRYETVFEPTITVSGKPVTPEEAEAAAVLIECMRRGWSSEHVPGFGCDPWACSVRSGPTPATAYLRALEAHGEERDDD